MSEQRDLGPDLSALGITWPYDEGDHITHAIVVMRVENVETGSSYVVYEATERMDPLIAEGLFARGKKLHERALSGYMDDD